MSCQAPLKSDAKYMAQLYACSDEDLLPVSLWVSSPELGSLLGDKKYGWEIPGKKNPAAWEVLDLRKLSLGSCCFGTSSIIGF